MKRRDFTPTLWQRLKDLLARAARGELAFPPWWLRDVGGKDFKETGAEFLRIFVDIAGLQPSAHVLEIGCGSGRMALPLTQYLETGAYVGIDVTPEAITWCRRHISRHHPNFTFLHADLYNKRYNPTGKQSAHTYTFPFDDREFDFIFLTSVFTHLLPQDARHYLEEVERLLASNGRGFFTFFLLNARQRSLAAEGRNDIQFRYGEEPYRVRDSEIPESAIAYREAFLLEELDTCGLALSGPIHYGTWSGRADGLSYQDILLVQLV
jgi:SAM-dependent methyltransferase